MDFELSCGNWIVLLLVGILLLIFFSLLTKLFTRLAQKAKSETKEGWKKQSYQSAINIQILQFGIYSILIISGIAASLLFGLICILKAFV